ncbi:MAG: hypothetical protein IPK19_14965 [Chloroflexi bacterium]|nr:hypothetical protein [Chloroflexota bacterium]
MNSKKALWIIVLVTLISTALASAASAQTSARPRAGEVELFGTVTQITRTTMTIQDGARIHLVLIARAEFETSVSIGDTIKVEAVWMPSGTWVASEVEDWDPTITGRRGDDGRGDDGRGDDGRGDDGRGVTGETAG